MAELPQSAESYRGLLAAATRDTIAGLERADPQAFRAAITLLENYGDLLQLLAECKDNIAGAGNTDGSRLQQGLRALRAVIAFLNMAPLVREHGLVLALAGLHSSLHDAGRGSSPAMLDQKPEESQAGSKPTGTMREYVEGHLAFALNLLLDGGIPQAEALLWLARTMAGLDVRNASGGPILFTQVQRWRYEIKRGKAPKTAIDQFETLRHKYLPLTNAPTSDLKRKAAQNSASLIIKNLANLAPRDAPPKRPRAK